jgi:hypothetical protein
MVTEIAVINPLAGCQETGVDGLLSAPGGDDVDGIHCPTFLVQCVKCLGDDLWSQPHHRKKDILHRITFIRPSPKLLPFLPAHIPPA